MNDVVPNLPPSAPCATHRLAVIAEAPGEAEQTWRVCSSGHGYPGWKWIRGRREPQFRCWCGSSRFTPAPQPLVGSAGDLITQLLKDNGLRREQVFLGHVSRVPLAADQRTLETPEVQSGLVRLADDLEVFAPNAVLVLGNLVLQAFRGDPNAKVSRWRGSITEGSLAWVTSVPSRFKVVVATNPAAVLYQPSDLCLLRKDVARAVEESRSSELRLPQMDLVRAQSVTQVAEELERLRLARQPLGFDLEGGPDTGITILSFASLPNRVFSIPLRKMDFAYWWPRDDEQAIWVPLRALLEDPLVPKVAWNASYEAFCLDYLHDIRIANLHDGMIAWWVLLCELDKGLDVAASVLTRIPCWGSFDDCRTEDERDTYNGWDSLATIQCWDAMQSELIGDALRFYEFQRSLLEPTLEIALRGVAWDSEGAKALAVELEQEALSAQGALDVAAGIAPPTFDEVRDTVAMKVHHAKCRDWADVVHYARPLMREPL